MPENADVTPGLSRPDLVRVLESAARLQAVVPDAILHTPRTTTRKRASERKAGTKRTASPR